jgi:hypothetical protein
MQGDGEGMMLVRADLCDRLEAVQRLARTHSHQDLLEQVRALKSLASAYGLVPVATLAEAFDRAMGETHRPGSAWPADIYIDRLRDAIGCSDDASTQGMLASIALRMGG